MINLDLQYFSQETDPPAEPAAEPKKPDTEPPKDPTEPTKTDPNPVPYDRFKEVNDGLKSFKSLGFDSAEQLKEKLESLTALEKAEEDRKKEEMSEAERLKAEKDEAAKKAEEASESAKKATESANKRILDSEIRSIARSLNANDVNDVLKLIDREGVEIDDEGNVKGVEEAVKALKDAKPWNFKASVGVDASGGSNPSKSHDGTELAAKEKEYEETRAAALKDSRLMGKVTKVYNELLALKSKQ